jgi:hypothetical protein
MFENLHKETKPTKMTDSLLKIPGFGVWAWMVPKRQMLRLACWMES